MFARVVELLKVTVCLCVYLLDGAGWVAGVRKELSAADDDNEQNLISLDDNSDNMVSQRCFCLSGC